MIDSALWVVPLAVLILGVRQPRWGVLVFFGALPFFAAPPGGPYLAQLDCAALAVLLTGWRAGRSGASILDRAVSVFALIGLLSLVPSPYRPPALAPRHWLDLIVALPETQVWGVFFSWRVALDLLVGWALFTTVRRAYTGRSLRPLGHAVGVGLGLSLWIGLIEAIGWIDLWGYRPIGGFLYDDRLHSVFFHSGWFAEYVVLATPFAVGALAAGSRRLRRVAVVLTAVAVAAMLLSQQRGGWITTGVQFALLLAVWLPFWRRANPRMLRRVAQTVAVAVGIATLVVVTVLVSRRDMREGVEDRIAVAVSDLSARTWVWQRASELAVERPLLGWGIGTFSPLLDTHFPDAFDPWGHRQGWLTAHSLYFHLLVESGVFGLLALAWILCLSLTAIIRSLRGEELAERQVAYGLLTSMAGFMVYGLVQHMLFVRSIAWLFWGLLGAVAALDGAVEGKAAAESQRLWTAHRRRRVAQLLTAAALVATVARPLWTPPPPARGSGEYGLHAPEVSGEGEDFRWTDGHAAERVRWLGSVLVLRMANGHPRGGARPVDVEVRLNGRVVLEERLHSGWKVFRLDVGPPSGESLLLEIDARPTFRPYREPAPASERSRDVRRLGVAVAPISWEDASS